MQWYVLYTRPNVEYRVANALREREFEVFLPEIVVHEPASKGSKTEPFFPCYMFMKADLHTIAPSSWRWTPGLRGMVTFGERPVTLPEYVIETIKQQLAGWSQRQGKPVQPYQRGELIRITEGPFADMVAIFNGPSTPGKRVQVLLKVLGQLSRVWLEAQHIEKLPLSEQPAQPSVPKRPRRTRGRGRTLH